MSMSQFSSLGYAHGMDVCPNDGNLLASGGVSKTIKIFDKRESTIVWDFKVHSSDLSHKLFPEFNYYFRKSTSLVCGGARMETYSQVPLQMGQLNWWTSRPGRYFILEPLWMEVNLIL